MAGEQTDTSISEQADNIVNEQIKLTRLRLSVMAWVQDKIDTGDATAADVNIAMKLLDGAGTKSVDQVDDQLSLADLMKNAGKARRGGGNITTVDEDPDDSKPIPWDDTAA